MHGHFYIDLQMTNWLKFNMIKKKTIKKKNN